MRIAAVVLLSVLLAATMATPADVPRPAAELSWVASDGQKLQLSQYKGKVVVVEVLSTTCPHCQFTARQLSRLQTEFGPKGVQVLGMAINDDANPAQFVRENNVNFPVGKGTRDTALAFLQHSLMSPLYFPGVVFIDRNGVIQGQYTGADPFLAEADQERNLRGMIQKLTSSGGAAEKTPAHSKARNRKASKT